MHYMLLITFFFGWNGDDEILVCTICYQLYKFNIGSILEHFVLLLLQGLQFISSRMSMVISVGIVKQLRTTAYLLIASEASIHIIQDV